MSPATVSILMFGSFFALLFLGVPMAWATACIGVVVCVLLYGLGGIDLLMIRIWDCMNNFNLMAIPLFVFMGNLLRRSGASADLFKGFYVWFAKVKGGMIVSGIALSALLGAMLGTVGASITILGITVLPLLQEYKHNLRLSTGAIMAGGGLAVLIPPSMMFIIYGVVAGESVAKLLIGGIVPGLMLAGLYSLYVIIQCVLNPGFAPRLPEEISGLSFKEKLKSLRAAWIPFIIIIGVTGTIFIGLATPTEAGALGVVGVLFSMAVRRELAWNMVIDSAFETFKTLGIIMWVVFGAMMFISTFTLSGGSTIVKEVLLGLPLGRWGVYCLILAILFYMGMIFDVIGITVLCAPVFVPVIKTLGFDPLSFGIIFNLMLQVGYLSPPFGYGMFYLKAVRSDLSLTELYKAALPFMLIQLIAVGIFSIWPTALTWLPKFVEF
ncbi:MAG: TRAP transporter large permease subunit [Candidatus Jordarchaeaceae archaeon]